MGVFDTVIVDPPLLCERCGATIEIQTKQFDPGMATYRIGSIISGSPVVVGVLKDSLFCPACYSAGRHETDPVYFVIWHHILAGVERTEAAAHARLASVDRLDLIEWLDQAQRGEREWRAHFRRFYRDIELWHEHVERETAKPDTESAGKESGTATRLPSGLFRLSEDILNSADPLGEILSQYREHSRESDGMF